MATVKDRFEHLGLAYNNKILMIVGVHISEKFQGSNFHPINGLRSDHSNQPQRIKKVQKEEDQEFMVWDYPEIFNKEMDRLILIFLEHYLDLNTKVSG